MELIEASLSEFTKIYSDMTKQFPENELKPIEYMKEILALDCYTALKAVYHGTDLGYVIIYQCKKNIFIEYLAVFKEFQSNGFGGRIINALKSAYPYSLGSYFEVEHENPLDINTSRRIRFYENLGCRLLTSSYYLPCPNEILPMNLYYLPHQKRTSVSFDEVISDLKDVFPIIYGRIPTHRACISEFKKHNKIKKFNL